MYVSETAVARLPRALFTFFFALGAGGDGGSSWQGQVLLTGAGVGA